MPPNDDAQRFAASLDVEIDLPLAGAGSRALARTVDFILLGVVQFLLAVVLIFVGAGAFGALGTSAAGWIIGAGLLVLFMAQWFVTTALELWTKGQTPGKRLLGLRVVRDDGGTLSLGPALLRNLLRLETVPGGVLVDLLVMALRADGKRLGDLVGGTLVVEIPRATVVRRFSPALDAAEVTLLESWYARAPELEPAQRSRLAERLVARLAAAHPGLVPEGEPLVALEGLAPVQP